ncbi:MAG: choice-of-anchor Q domain-containing protein [Lentimicrobium sp.]
MKNILLSAILITTGFACYAAQIIVTNTNDSGAGSLRDKVAIANATDTIVFDPSLNESTITLTSGNIAFAKTLTIIGPGYNLLTISGNSNSRIFDITGGSVTIKGLKLMNGSQTDPAPNDGGAIRHVTAGTLTLNNVYFDNNIAVNGNGSQGGSVYYAVYGGYFTGDSCFFMNSQSDDYGGAVSFNGVPASVSLNFCWFDGNSATGPCGGLFTNAQSVTVENSTFSNNVAAQRAAIWLSKYGSGTETYSFTNCTFSNNTATVSPYEEFGVTSGTLSLINCTYTNNSEPIFVGGDWSSNGTLVVQNSIFDNVGDNFTSLDAPVLTSLGGNISNDATMSSFLTSTNDLNSTNPLIGALANNGGLMQTHALLSGSPAIDNGINSGAPSTDQIGNPRGTTIDGGSLEYICVPATGTATIIACGSYTWIDGNTYTSSNNTATFNIVGGAANGCDSLVTLNLTINNVSDITTSLNGITITANNIYATYVWLDCNANYAVIPGETSQSFTASENGNYAVQLTENSCVDTSACVAVTTVGIIDNTFTTNLNIYPNPTGGNLNIAFDAIQDELNVSLYSLDGKLLENRSAKNVTKLSFEIEAPAGIYVLKISNNYQAASLRIVKK